MTTYKTAELEGALLDAAVAKAEGHAVRLETAPFAGGWMEQWPKGNWEWIRHPATHWNRAGPLIERDLIELSNEGATWHAELEHLARADGVQRTFATGPTPLIAAMRAYVASKLGETVELP